MSEAKIDISDGNGVIVTKKIKVKSKQIEFKCSSSSFCLKLDPDAELEKSLQLFQ